MKGTYFLSVICTLCMIAAISLAQNFAPEMGNKNAFSALPQAGAPLYLAASN